MSGQVVGSQADAFRRCTRMILVILSPKCVTNVVMGVLLVWGVEVTKILLILLFRLRV